MKLLAISAISLINLISWPLCSSWRHYAQIGRKFSAHDFSKQMKMSSKDWCFFSFFEQVREHFILEPLKWGDVVPAAGDVADEGIIGICGKPLRLKGLMADEDNIMFMSVCLFACLFMYGWIDLPRKNKGEINYYCFFFLLFLLSNSFSLLFFNLFVSLGFFIKILMMMKMIRRGSGTFSIIKQPINQQERHLSFLLLWIATSPKQINSSHIPT